MRYPLQLMVTAAVGGCLLASCLAGLALAAGCSPPTPIATPTGAAPERHPSFGATPAVLSPARRDSASSTASEPAAVRSTPTPAPWTPSPTRPTPRPALSGEHGAQPPTPTPHSQKGALPAMGDRRDDRPPPRPTSAATAARLVPGAPMLHRVEAGDTVYQLAARYGASWEAILQANGLDEQGARHLDIGQELVIPIGAAAGGGKASALQVVHQVQAGEVLITIAQDYGTTVEAIVAANRLGDAELILAGQELIVPLPPTGSGAPLAVTESLPQSDAITETTVTASEPLTDTVQAKAGPAAALAALEAAMVRAVNAEREARGLPAYRVDETLAAVARAHAQDMVARDYVGHTSPEGKRVRDRLRDAGLDLDRAGENYYVTTRPAEEAVATTLAWFMGDPSHRDNVLHGYYTRIGVGVAYRPPGWYIFVLDFAGD